MDIKNIKATGAGLMRKYLEKLGVSDYTDLSADEKRTYDQWDTVLSRDLTLENLRDFLGKQLVTLSKELREAVGKGEDRLALRIAARLENYEAMAAFIDEPNRTREQLIIQLKNLTEN